MRPAEGNFALVETSSGVRGYVPASAVGVRGLGSPAPVSAGAGRMANSASSPRPTSPAATASPRASRPRSRARRARASSCRRPDVTGRRRLLRRPRARGGAARPAARPGAAAGGGERAAAAALPAHRGGGAHAPVSAFRSMRRDRRWRPPRATRRCGVEPAGRDAALVIRPPMGPGQEGELDAVAWRPTAPAWWSPAIPAPPGITASASTVRCPHRAAAGALHRLPAPVQHLAFSADGARLAAGFAGRTGVKVWDAANGRLLFEDTAYGGPVRMVAFDAAGRLATSSVDGAVRLYGPDGRRIAQRVPVQGGRPHGIAFSPDGGLIGIGFEDRLRVEVVSATICAACMCRMSRASPARGCRR